MASKRIGILTGGGDVPGLNQAIKGVVYRAAELGHEVVGLRRGWEGLTHLNMDDEESKARYIKPLDRQNTRTVDRTGGTFLHTCRTNPAEDEEGAGFPQRRRTIRSARAPSGASNRPGLGHHRARLRNLSALKLDYLVAIGGDDTLSYAARLTRRGLPRRLHPEDDGQRRAQHGVLHRLLDGHHPRHRRHRRQRSTVGSHERIGIFRVFGRDAGYTSLYTAYVQNIRCAIPEYKVDLKRMIELLIQDKKDNPSNYSIVVLSEGAEWEGIQGHRSTASRTRSGTARR